MIYKWLIIYLLGTINIEDLFDYFMMLFLKITYDRFVNR